MEFGLGPIEAALPNGSFPTGAVHEFISTGREQAAASGGFMAGLLNPLMRRGGICIWISSARTLFPPALKAFGVAPDRVIFVDIQSCPPVGHSSKLLDELRIYQVVHTYIRL